MPYRFIVWIYRNNPAKGLGEKFCRIDLSYGSIVIGRRLGKSCRIGLSYRCIVIIRPKAGKIWLYRFVVWIYRNNPSSGDNEGPRTNSALIGRDDMQMRLSAF